MEGIKIVPRSPSDKEVIEIDTDSDNPEDESTVENSGINTENSGKDAADTIEISSKLYYKESVRNVFDYMIGKTEALETCKNLKLVANMIYLCQNYGLARPLAICMARLEDCTRSICFCNLLEALYAEKVLYEVEGCKGQSDELFERCLAYARANLGYRQTLANLILQYESGQQFFDRMLEELQFDSKAKIRYLFRIGDLL